MLALSVMFAGLSSPMLRGGSVTLADTSARLILLLFQVGIPRHSIGVALSTQDGIIITPDHFMSLQLTRE